MQLYLVQRSVHLRGLDVVNFWIVDTQSITTAAIPFLGDRRMMSCSGSLKATFCVFIKERKKEGSVAATASVQQTSVFYRSCFVPSSRRVVKLKINSQWMRRWHGALGDNRCSMLKLPG